MAARVRRNGVLNETASEPSHTPVASYIPTLPWQVFMRMRKCIGAGTAFRTIYEKT